MSGDTAGVELPAALYLPDGDAPGSFRATALTIGPWESDVQHAGPPAALLAREVERTGAVPGAQTVRLAYDILGPVPVGPVRVTGRVLRPGRRVELVEATLEAGGAARMRVTAWRMRVRETSPVDVLAPDAPHPVGPDAGRTEVPAFFRDEIAYHRALEWRFTAGSFNAPGPAAAWTRPLAPLVAGEPITPLEHLLVMTDAASGISAELDWERATFANVDLLVSLHRRPAGEWLGVDAATSLGPGGAAQCFADLFDATGRIGRSAASLFVEPR
jgi:Thioesterase-like superfamily